MEISKNQIKTENANYAANFIDINLDLFIYIYFNYILPYSFTRIEPHGVKTSDFLLSHGVLCGGIR
jgi:hypothetical protein